MANNEEVKIIINAEDKASGVFSNVEKSAGSLSSGLGTVAKVAGGALVAGFAAMGAELYRGVKAADEATAATLQMEAVLESTGGAVGLFIEDLEDQADALERTTTFSAEAVKGAQNMLLTFTNVKGPVFQGAIDTILDLSTAMGQDLKSSAIQLGKALNDPITGITALTRVGVTFTDEQKRMIETLVRTGKTADAQRIILAELNREFGGSASAAANTFAGRLTILMNLFGQLEEAIGGAFVRAITPAILKLTEFLKGVDFEAIGMRIEAIGTKFSIFFMDELPGIISGAINWIKDFIVAVQQNSVVIAVVDALRSAFLLVWESLQNSLTPALRDLWAVIQPYTPELKQFGEIIAKVFGGILLGALLVVIKSLGGLLALATEVLAVFTRITTFIIDFGLKSFDALTTALSKVITTFERIVEAVQKAKDAIASFGMSPGASLNPFSANFQLPHFANGGIVTGPTIAMVGEAGPEAIVPLSKMNSMGGITINVTGNSFLDQEAPRKMVAMIMDELKLELRI